VSEDLGELANLLGASFQEDLGPARDDPRAELISNDSEVRVILPEEAHGREVSQLDTPGGLLVQSGSFRCS
jgi:hypothetical protein